MGKGSKPHRAKPARKIRRAARSVRVGRPLKSGERYPSGRLKPQKIEPNERIVELRRALLDNPEATGGELAHAENPLALMKARGWLTGELAQAGQDFARWHAAGCLCAPSVKASSPEPKIKAASAARADPVALWRLRRVYTALHPAASAQLVEVCIMSAWPAWLLAAALEQSPWRRAASLNDAKRQHLIAALEAARDAALLAPPDGLALDGSELSQFVNHVRGIDRAAA